MSERGLGRVAAVNTAQATYSLAGFCIDGPTTGDPLHGYEALIRGWVLARRSRVRAVQLVDPSLDRVFRESGLNESRPDVAAHYPRVASAEQSGFRIGFSLLNLLPEATVEIVALLEDGSRASLGEVSYSRSPLATVYTPRIQPLMVSCLGRSGSTLLMGMLRNHARIVVHGDAPFESRLCKYYVHNLLKTLAEPPDSVAPGFKDETYAANAHWLSVELPLDPRRYRRLRGRHIENLAAFCQREIDEVYAEVASEQGPLGAVPRFFAEKHGAGHTPRLLWELYPDAREIILVRDFRDMFCSARAYNRRRGIADFGMDGARSDEEFLEITRERAWGLVKSMRSRDRHVHVMKYEDLVNDPLASVSAALAYIGVEKTEEFMEQVLAQTASRDREGHRTSASAASSIGRWRHDLPRALRKECERSLAEALDAFGYG